MTSLREVSGSPLREHGVLAPNAKLRALVVPQGPEVQERTTEVAAASECETETFQARPHRISWARLLEPYFPQVAEGIYAQFPGEREIQRGAEV